MHAAHQYHPSMQSDARADDRAATLQLGVNTLRAHCDDHRAAPLQLSVNTLRTYCDDGRAITLQLSCVKHHVPSVGYQVSCISVLRQASSIGRHID